MQVGNSPSRKSTKTMPADRPVHGRRSVSSSRRDRRHRRPREASSPRTTDFGPRARVRLPRNIPVLQISDQRIANKDRTERVIPDHAGMLVTLHQVRKPRRIGDPEKLEGIDGEIDRSPTARSAATQTPPRSRDSAVPSLRPHPAGSMPRTESTEMRWPFPGSRR